MKKILFMLLVLVIAVPCFAKEYRVIADLQFENEADAIAVINAIEDSKDKVRVVETMDGWNPTAKFVESWDTEDNNQSEWTRFHVDFKGEKKVHVVVDTDDVAIQEKIDSVDVNIAKKEAELLELQTIKSIKEAELIKVKDKKVIAK